MAIRAFVNLTAGFLIVFGLTGAADDAKTKKEATAVEKVRKVLQDLDQEWSAAMAKNDAEAIGRFMSEDWVIIGPDGNVIDRARFLGLIKSGDLTHESVATEDWRLRVYGDTAVVTAQAKSEGKFKGQAFTTHERSTSVFVRQDGRWQCVLTQLTPINKK
jgi:ketosteroid isomerase-like protein